MLGLKWFKFENRSFMGRLLLPVNIISFVFLMCLCALMVMRAVVSVENAVIAEVEGFGTFLQNAGQPYVAKYDASSLSSLARIVITDSDITSVLYSDRDGKTIVHETKKTDPAKTSKKEGQIEKVIQDAKGSYLGKLQLSYKTDRIDDAFWSSLKIGIIGGILIQFCISCAIYFIGRSIARPLLESLSRLTQTTEILSETSQSVSKFSDALSSGVGQQAEVVQETTSSMSQMSSMLTQTASYAKQSDTVMAAVTQKANEGMSVMNQMVEAMASVQQANEHMQQMVEIIQEIGNKTKVINDIVFKTQLLSFNASIEAARAGTHGRGFAVVAEEVGNLAKMSGSAAQEITALLQDSERQVNEIVHNNTERVTMGQNVTFRALKGFKEIASDINLISSQIGNISAAAREQELGVAQTNLAMSELNKTTDLNSNIANSASTASTILASEVESLNEIAQAIEISISGTKVPSSKKRLRRQEQKNEFDSESNEEFEALSHSTDEQEKNHSEMGAHRRSILSIPEIEDQPRRENSLPAEAAKPSEDSSSSRGTLSDENVQAATVELDSLTDKIVEMAKKQRTEKKARQSS
jgi:methyl-accepting chemotaxis protein